MAAQVDTAGTVYAIIGGGIAGVSCAEEVSEILKCHKCVS